MQALIDLEPLIFSIVRSAVRMWPCLRWHDFDDLLQDGRIAAVAGINAYRADNDRGASLKTYVRRCVEFRMSNHVRAARRAARKVNFQQNTELSRGETEEGPAYELPDSSPSPEATVDLRMQIAHILSHLRGQELELALYLCSHDEERTYHTWATAKGFSKQRGHQVLKRMRESAQNLGGTLSHSEHLTQ